MSNSYQTHHFNSMNHLIQLSYSHHVKTHKSQLIHHPIHKGHSVHNLKDNTHTSILSTFGIKEKSRPATFSPSFSLRKKGLAQARRTLAQASSLRLGESSTSSIVALHAFSLKRESPCLSETFARSIKSSGSPGRPFVENNLGEPLLISPRRDQLAWASLLVLATVFTHSRHIGIPKQWSHHIIHP